LTHTFKDILQIRKEAIMRTERVKDFKPELYAIGLWRYEWERVFSDKLVKKKDKDTVLNAINDRHLHRELRHGTRNKREVCSG
jgi:hypothetical protein